MRIFLDVGAHIGETIEVVIDPDYGFDRIVAFEPSARCWAALDAAAAADPRVEICRFGLFDHDCEMELHDPGQVGASVLSDESDQSAPREKIALRDAADWIAEETSPTDFIVIKTNCEGSEIAILNRLLDAGLMDRPVLVLITFDIRNFPKLAHQELKLRKRLRQAGLRNFCFSDEMMIGTTHKKRISHWLRTFGIDQPDASRAQIERDYAATFARFSRCSGRRQRFEAGIKRWLGYQGLPEPVKAALRWAKRTAGFGRERDIPVSG